MTNMRIFGSMGRGEADEVSDIDLLVDYARDPPRAFIFGGKAAPGYFMAKRAIKLINAVAETENVATEVNTRLRIAFVSNFNVQNAHLICPAGDLSEQISTAGKEASGTANMKLMLNDLRRQALVGPRHP